jgi:hypothetical protein
MDTTMAGPEWDHNDWWKGKTQSGQHRYLDAKPGIDRESKRE